MGIIIKRVCDEMKLVSLTDSLRELKKIIDSSITDLTLDILTTEVQIFTIRDHE